MSEEHTETGTGWPVPPAAPAPATPADPRPDSEDPDELSPLAPREPAPRPEAEPADPPRPAEPPPATDDSAATTVVLPPPVAPSRRLSSAGVVIAVLLALLGFTLVVQLKTTSTDPSLSAARQEDLVRILSDLDQRESRLRQDIAALEDSQRQLTSGVEGRQAALEEARRRADELGILAGTLPAKGPGLSVRFESVAGPVEAFRILDAVQELRGAGAEAMQISDAGGAGVRVIASTYFLDASGGGLVVDGRRLSGPLTILVIGDPDTMRTALRIPGGVVSAVERAGGNVIVEEREVVEVSALHDPIELEHARPVT
ncbi:DUF881 domain-containing protein [Micromonospora yangpuensis]|uniref:Uncharacterized conserved protein YlxW, UPF0749 family n=1 Tax=Micromonospora yangpuensis TaxID=683228 RepID=A0A1C6UQG4_9ACTN|nr:DUF881 domain-containing protein [Micromonospora yangpuensis]GGM07586.1 hypothetical protein GCM10012279_27010 [Micromonospora yangpuensis]SCL56307.1 Uncharacterized conserved protein YlxW, UPF0749 family [Micromonospora yangpuensis]